MLVIPNHLQRNTSRVAAEGYEKSGQRLMFLARDRSELELKDSDILDIGCGVRFTATILNNGLDVKSYTGIEVHRPIIDFLKKEVADPRFHFIHWDVHNALYNKDGLPMSSFTSLPVKGQYNAIWLFSVFTHLNPTDSTSMLDLIRKIITENGKLVFTCFINDEVETFLDRDANLVHAQYGENFMHSIIANTGWSIDNWHWGEIREKNPYGRMYVCSPV